MALIVNDSFHLSSHNPTLAEKLERAEVWARVLYPVVPESDLQAAFDRAFQNHKSGFVINAYDLKAAYDTFLAEKAAKPHGNAGNRPFNCPRCFGSGMEMILDANGRTLGVRKGCSHLPPEPGENFNKN